MKKLLIIAAVALAAVASQAATFTWKTYTGQKVYMMDSSTYAASMTAYLFDSEAVTQADVVTAFANGTIGTLSYLDTATTTATGTIAAHQPAVSWGSTGDTLTAFFAIVVDDNIFVSTTAQGVGQASADTLLQFKGLSSPSQAAAMDASAGYSTAGWYAAVPEPTSGLLLLLGMAGLALKRKQA